MRRSLVLGTLVYFAGAAAGQYPPQTIPGQFPGQQYPGPSYGASQFGQYGQSGPLGPYVMPNVFNPAQQPLSPYLNLLRGGNPATNYYYGVRPGTLGMGPRGFGGAPFMAGGGPRPLFFPQLAIPEQTSPDIGPGDVLPPAGHPTVFSNTMGFYPSPFGSAGGARHGLSGLGTTPPPAKK